MITLTHDVYERITNYIKKYPGLIDVTPPSVPYYETFRNLSESWARKKKVEEPTEEARIEYAKLMALLEGQKKESVTCNLIELIGLKDRLTNHLLKTVKREEPNIRKILNVCLSAYTDDPINLAFVSISSTGKTYLVESVTRYFPAEDLIVLKSIS